MAAFGTKDVHSYVDVLLHWYTVVHSAYIWHTQQDKASVTMK